MTRLKGWVALLVLLAILCSGSLAESRAAVTWTVEEGSLGSGVVILFSGSVKTEEARGEGWRIALEVIPEPDRGSRGSIVFTSLAGRRIATRRQNAETALPSADGPGEVAFSASWTIPEDQYYRSAVAAIQVLDEQGAIVCRQELTIGEGDDAQAVWRFPIDTGLWIRWVFIAAAIVWAAAGIRVWMIRKNDKIRRTGQHADL